MTEVFMAEKKTDIAPREQQPAAARRDLRFDPIRMMDRFADEMDRAFEDVFGRGWLTPRLARDWMRSPNRGEIDTWAPQLEVSHRNNELVIRADLPGLGKDDVKVDVTDDRLTIQGERKREHEEERGGVYRSERSYGSFYREIPLPEGTISDQAKATFKDGVLEITMPAPPEQVRRGRRVEITDPTSTQK
jgi:HSP20 family protein